eukprot:NODE_43_length_28809_cov_0.237200.p21 type:complete len:116 gc:universal NODE_43_length_28809_cov_0.237200:16609-16262(-)
MRVMLSDVVYGIVQFFQLSLFPKNVIVFVVKITRHVFRSTILIQHISTNEQIYKGEFLSTERLAVANNLRHVYFIQTKDIANVINEFVHIFLFRRNELVKELTINGRSLNSKIIS